MLIKEISELVNSDVKVLLGQVKVTMLGAQVVCIQNFIKLVSYSPNEVVFKVKNNEFVVAGVELDIAELGTKEVVIKGKINRMYYVKEAKNAQKELWCQHCWLKFW